MLLFAARASTSPPSLPAGVDTYSPGVQFREKPGCDARATVDYPDGNLG